LHFRPPTLFEFGHLVAQPVHCRAQFFALSIDVGGALSFRHVLRSVCVLSSFFAARFSSARGVLTVLRLALRSFGGACSMSS
jgi:hypothetical protein